MLTSFIKGLLFGSAVGGTAGLLAAPRSGNETRQKLTQELNDAAETTEELNASLARFRDAVVNTSATARETLPVVQTTMKKDIEAFKFQAAPRIKQIKGQVAKLNEHVAQLQVKE